MRIFFRALLVFVAVTAAVTALSAQAPAAGQAQGYRAPRTADGRPNLNGIWQAINEANWDLQPHAANFGRVVALGAEDAMPPGIGWVEGGEIPYLPAAAAKKKENYEKRFEHQSDPRDKREPPAPNFHEPKICSVRHRRGMRTRPFGSWVWLG